MANELVSFNTTTATLPTSVQSVIDARILQLASTVVPANNPLTPLTIGDGGSTIPVRPAYNGPVLFNTTTFVPTGGSTAGGTAKMVAGLDVWLGNSTIVGPNIEQYLVESPAGTGTYPNRPATTSMVAWKGIVAPSGGGTTAGGTPLMVNNLDEFHFYAT